MWIPILFCKIIWALFYQTLDDRYNHQEKVAGRKMDSDQVIGEYDE